MRLFEEIFPVIMPWAMSHNHNLRTFTQARRTISLLPSEGYVLVPYCCRGCAASISPLHLMNGRPKSDSLMICCQVVLRHVFEALPSIPSISSGQEADGCASDDSNTMTVAAMSSLARLNGFLATNHDLVRLYQVCFPEARPGCHQTS